MQTEGYTIFTKPLKNSNKKINETKENTEMFKKIESTNKKGLDGKYVAKILNAEEDKMPVSMPHDLRIALAQARNAKGLTQDQFSKLIQIPKSDVNAWEAGKSVPPGALIAKMDKILGVKLPRPPKK